MPRLSLYLMWMDTAVYGWALLCAAALAAAIYSIMRLAQADAAAPEAAAEFPYAGLSEAAAGAEPLPADDGSAPALPEETKTPLPAPAVLAPAPEPAAVSPAENFVRGIYEGVAGLDARLKDVEASLAKNRGGGDFAVKFLEDLSADIDSLDKAKIKARLEYLLADLKK